MLKSDLTVRNIIDGNHIYRFVDRQPIDPKKFDWQINVKLTVLKLAIFDWIDAITIL